MGHYSSDYEYEYETRRKDKIKELKKQLNAAVDKLKEDDYQTAIVLLKNVKTFKAFAEIIREISD